MSGLSSASTGLPAPFRSPDFTTGRLARFSFVALPMLVLVLAGLGLSGTSSTVHAPIGTTSSNSIRAVDLPGFAPLSPTGHLRAGTSPIRAFSSEFYTQIGSTLSQINDTSSISGLSSVSETITLVNSLYHTAYELNTLSDTGDWYQIVVSVNWPGCAAGFEEGLEVWDSIGNSGPVVCDPTVSLSLGDRVNLWLRFNGTSQACLGLRDLSTGKAHEICQAQPDVGGKKFIFLQSAANSVGYYTGTMTEIINQTTATCPDYTVMPTVTFSFPSWAHISAYVPWSDEWDLASGTLCYEYRGGVESVPAGDLTSHFVDTAASTSYGPHWVEGQNDTPLNGSVGFRFQSDPNPITFENLSASTTTPYLGEKVYLNATTTGGIAPYQTLWVLNGSFSLGWGSASRTFTTLHPGNYTYTAYALDKQGDVSLGASVLIREPYPLWTGAVLSTKGGSADVGQVVNFSARVTGGVAWVSLTWLGLPPGCASVNASWVRCTPSAALTTLIDVQRAMAMERP
ncbi:MAG: hypothetical protein L3J97_02230 [Thermoplasmata archaeon]|nr:hypothetical protein [Thermoplasmata archaeon]